MKDKLGKIADWRPSPKAYTCAAAVMLVVLLIPLLRLTIYSVPCSDDYIYGRYAKVAIETGEGLLMTRVLASVWDCIRTSWHAWQGTYSSIFFMVLMPGIWGEQYYCIGPMFLILFLAVSVMTLVYTLLHTVLKTDRIQALGIATASASLTLLMIHTAQDGFYWFNGGMHYVGMHSFCMLLVSVAVKILYSEKAIKRYGLILAGMLLALIVAGANFVTALQGLLICLSILFCGFLKKDKRVFGLFPILAVYAGGFYMNVMAPGNDKRSYSYIGWGLSPAKSVLASFQTGAEMAWEFTGWMTIVFLLLMLPSVIYMVKRVTFSFKLPGLVTLWSVCLYATGFTPSLFSLGHKGLERTLNAVKLTWQLLLILNLVYWCGWIVSHHKQIKGTMYRWWYYGVLAVTALVVFHTETNQAGSFSSYGAYYYIRTGEAYNFYQEYLGRVEVLKSDAMNVRFDPYVWKPWFLCRRDLSDNPDSSSNIALAAWYDKESVALRKVEKK